MIRGRFTPFLAPSWKESEFALIGRWLRGDGFPDARNRLEQECVRGLEGRTGVAFNMGRSAIQTALEQFQFPAGSEVLVPSFSCSGVVVPVLKAGLHPVLFDVDAHFNPRFESVLEADGPHVRAAIIPHLSGLWCGDMDRILAWAASRNIRIIEDCAQAYGLEKNGRFAGTFGDVGIFSSGLGKPLFGPGGGWLIGTSEIIAGAKKIERPEEPRESVERRIRKFIARYTGGSRHRGRAAFTEIVRFKLGRRMPALPPPEDSYAPHDFSLYAISDIEAELALAQIGRIGAIIGRRRDHASWWRERLSAMNFKTLHLLPPENNIGTKMILSFVGEGAEREARLLKSALWSNGIETESTYTPLHLRPYFRGLRKTALPMTEQQWRHAYVVPVRPNLTEADFSRAARALDEVRM